MVFLLGYLFILKNYKNTNAPLGIVVMLGSGKGGRKNTILAHLLFCNKT